MKTPEDEAFDDIARRQGAWGGGYQAKRKMAADKLQEPIPPNLRINCTVKDDVNPNGISPEKWRGQSNIESQHNACQHKDYCKQLKAALAQPAQEPVARVSGTHGGRFVYDPINRAMVLPVGMALYAGPPQREWVELMDDEVMEMMGYDKQYGHIPQYARNFVEAISAKLKEKNNGT